MGLPSGTHLLTGDPEQEGASRGVSGTGELWTPFSVRHHLKEKRGQGQLCLPPSKYARLKGRVPGAREPAEGHLSRTSALLPAQLHNFLLQEALPVPPGRRNLSPQQPFLGSLLCHLGLSPIQLAKGNFLPLTELLQGKDHIRFRPVSPRHVEDAFGLLNRQVKWLDPVPNPDGLVNWSGDETWSMEVKNYGPEAAVLIGIPAGLLAPCPWKIPFPWSLGDAWGLAQLKHSRNDCSYYHQHHSDFSRDKGTELDSL